MKRKNLLILILGLIAALIIMPAVIAANEGLIGSILGPLAGKDFLATYMKYSTFIDMVIYLVLFWGLAEWTLGSKMEGKGKMVMTGIALIMAVSLALFEGAMGFNLISFGPLVFTILVCLLGFAIYKGLDKAGMDKKYALSLCYLGVYIVVTSVVVMATSGEGIAGSIEGVSFGFYDSDWFQMGTGIAGLLALPALFLLGSWLVHKIPGWKKVPGGALPGGAAPPPRGPTPPAMQPEEEKKKEDAETKAEEAFTIEERNILKQVWDELVKVIKSVSKGVWTKDKKNETLASLDLITKQLKKIKSLDQKVRRLARKIRRMAKKEKIDSLNQAESNAMTYADEIKKADVDLMKKIEDVHDKFKSDKPGSIGNALGTLRSGAVQKDIRTMWSNIAILLKLEEEVDKELKAKS